MNIGRAVSGHFDKFFDARAIHCILTCRLNEIFG